MSERHTDEGSLALLPGVGTRERVRQAWRDIHEAVYYAANATRCAQFADFADLRARRGDMGGDLDALRCMQQGGQLVGDAARCYEHLHADFTALMRRGDDAGVDAATEAFTAAVHELEVQLWALVPVEQLPVGMFAPVNVGTSGQLRLVRRYRRAGDFAL